MWGGQLWPQPPFTGDLVCADGKASEPPQCWNSSLGPREDGGSGRAAGFTGLQQS